MPNSANLSLLLQEACTDVQHLGNLRRTGSSGPSYNIETKVSALTWFIILNKRRVQGVRKAQWELKAAFSPYLQSPT